MREDRLYRLYTGCTFERVEPGANFNPHHGAGGKFASADAGAAPPKRKQPPANRPTRPEERVPGAAPKPKKWREPPPTAGKKGVGKVGRPTGDRSQTRIGDQGEDLAKKLGFRNILPKGKRNFTPEQRRKLGSSIDVEYDSSGRLYELKVCSTTSTEYRLKSKLDEKKDKLRYARKVKGTAYTMVGVRDEAAGEVHFYGSKEPGLTGRKVSPDAFDYLGTVRL